MRSSPRHAPPSRAQAINAASHPNACLTEDDFEAKLREWCDRARAPPAARPLAERLPVGARVEARDLKRAEINGRVGVVERHDEAKRRVGVRFGEPHGLLSIPARNLLALPGRADAAGSAND